MSANVGLHWLRGIFEGLFQEAVLKRTSPLGGTILSEAGGFHSRISQRASPCRPGACPCRPGACPCRPGACPCRPGASAAHALFVPSSRRDIQFPP